MLNANLKRELNSALNLMNNLKKKFDSYQYDSYEAMKAFELYTRNPIITNISSLNGYQFLIDNMYYAIIPISQLNGLEISTTIMHSTNRGIIKYIDLDGLGGCLSIPLFKNNNNENDGIKVKEINCGINIEILLLPNGNKKKFEYIWICNYAFVNQ